MHVVLSLDPGGTERLVIEICRSLMDDVQPLVCCLDGPGAWAPEVAALDVPLVALHRRPGFRPGLGLTIGRLAEEHGVDVLHCHHYSPFVYWQIAALRRRRLGVVFTEHGRLSDDGPSFKRRVINPILGRIPSTICAVSSDLRRHMVAEGLPADRVRVIHNGIVPLAQSSPIARSMARLALGVPQDAFVVGAVGRLDPVKDLGTLMKAAELMAGSVSRLKVVVIGEGPERAAIEQQIDALGLRQVVILAGYRSDVRQLLPALDVYVNTSTHEGVSLTILEAMSASIPVVATRVGGTPEVVQDQKTGLLVAARSPIQVAAAIASFDRTPDERRRFGAAGRARVERHFSLKAMAGAYLETYRETAGH